MAYVKKFRRKTAFRSTSADVYWTRNKEKHKYLTWYVVLPESMKNHGTKNTNITFQNTTKYEYLRMFS
jgi:hypothetical protein